MLFREEICESLTLKFANAARERKSKGKPIISLGLGEPDFNTPQEIIDAVSKILKNGNSGYSDPMGIKSLREKICAKLNKENNVNTLPENIIITAGAKPALQIALMAILEPNDEVIVVSPYFVSYVPQIYIAEPTSKIIEIDLIDAKIDYEKLAKSINKHTKAIIINSPNNPMGYVLKEEHLKELYNLALVNNVYVISDEVYEKLVFPQYTHLSIGSLENKPKNVFTINGFSKSHAMTGWRLGYLCFPKEYYEIINRLQQNINTNTCTFIQQAIDSVFNFDKYYLKEYMEELILRLKIIKNYLGKSGILSYTEPESGFFIFVDISKTGLDSNTFCSKLIEEYGVALTPGIAFGKNWDNHVRLSYAINREELKKGINFILEFTSKI